MWKLNVKQAKKIIESENESNWHENGYEKKWIDTKSTIGIYSKILSTREIELIESKWTP